MGKVYSKNKLIADWVVFIVLIALSCYFGIKMGLSTALDVTNYHLYAPYALFNGRIGIDFLPGDIQSYFNPYLDIPFYLMIKYWNNYPQLILGLNACYYGVYLFLFYKFCDVFIKLKGLEKNIVLIFCMALAMTSPVLLCEINLLSHDTQLGIGVLATLFLLLKNLFVEKDKKQYMLIGFAGFILGATTGLKLVTVFYCLAIFITMICFGKSIPNFFKTLLIFCCSVVFGFILVDGYWMWLIYSHFKNPFFPYFNNIFKSPYADVTPLLDSDFAHLRAKNLYEFIFYPFLGVMTGKTRGFERSFFDLRYAMSYIAMFIFFVFACFKVKDKKEKLLDYNVAGFIVLFSALSYFIGMLIFAQYRYFIPLNSLAPLIVLMVLYSFINNKFALYSLITIIGGIILGCTGYINESSVRIKPFSKFYYVKDMGIKDNSLVLLASRSTSAYIIPQNQNAKYVYLAFPKHFQLKRLYFMHSVYYRSDYMTRFLSEEIPKYKDNLYILYRKNFAYRDSYMYQAAINYYSGGKLDGFYDCNEVVNNLHVRENLTYYLCKVKIKD